MSRPNYIANRDQNDCPVGLGVSSVDLKTPLQLRVDPVTNYLLVQSIANSSGNVSTRHRIDQDDRPTSYGWNGTNIVPIATDINGYLLTQST
jgi:hypothetical protein